MRFLVTFRVKVKGWLGSALGLGFGLGKLSYRTGGLPPGLGFRLGKLRYRTGVRGLLTIIFDQ